MDQNLAHGGGSSQPFVAPVIDEEVPQAKKRGFSSGQLEILKREIDADDARIAAFDITEEKRAKIRRVGPMAILRKCPLLGFNFEGTRGAMERYRRRGTFERVKGSGRKKSVRTQEKIQDVKVFLEQRPQASRGDIARDLDIKRYTVRNILPQDLNLKCAQ